MTVEQELASLKNGTIIVAVDTFMKTTYDDRVVLVNMWNGDIGSPSEFFNLYEEFSGQFKIKFYWKKGHRWSR